MESSTELKQGIIKKKKEKILQEEIHIFFKKNLSYS